MSAGSDFLEKAVLDHVFNKSAYAQPANLYVALCESAPTDADTGTTLAGKEATYTGYARKQTSPSDWNAATSPTGRIDNANPITFDPATGGSSTVTHMAILDAASGGNMLYHGPLNASLAVSSGVTPEFAAGDLAVTLD